MRKMIELCQFAVGFVSRSREKHSSEEENVKRRRFAWHNDGPAPNVNSLAVVVKWLSSENNYNRWRGSDKHCRKTKGTLAQEIATLIADSGIKAKRNAKGVITKIAAIEKQFREASDWLKATGAGVESEQSLHDAVLERCPCYYDVEAVMGNRPSTQPSATQQDIRQIPNTMDDEMEKQDVKDQNSVMFTPSSPEKTITSNSTKPRTKPSVKRLKLCSPMDMDLFEIKRQVRQLKDMELTLQEQRMKQEFIKLEAENRLLQIKAAAACSQHVRK